MQPEENQVDPERGSSAAGGPDSPSLPLPILLRVPWFPPEAPAPTAAPASEDAGPPLEMAETPFADSTMPAPAWREQESPRRRWPVLAALAGCLCAIAIGAVVDDLWWPRPSAGRPQVRRSATRSQTASPATAPASEIEPLLAIPSVSRPEAPPAPSAPVQAVSLSPDIIPIESGEEP